MFEEGKEMELCAAVVVYNTHCEDSSTCRALSEIQDPQLRVIVYDNSTSDYGNRVWCEQHGWTYLGGQGNVGISKAYNGCVDWAAENQRLGLICMFDDDTHVDADYFRILRREAVQSGASIFVPLIYSGGRLLSPCKLSAGHQATLFAGEEEAKRYSGRDISAINSGMAIRLEIFADYRYDENIFLDGVDHTFVQDMLRAGNGLHILPYRCDHEFSGDSKPPIKSALMRFQTYAADYRYILRNNKTAYWTLVGKRALKLTVQYRTLAFLRRL